MSVFISYRRDGGYDLAYHIYDRIKDMYDVFFDIESMKSGRFDEQLYDRIEQSTDFVIILSKGALDRCSNTDDWVRLEYMKAYQLNKNIIPVVMPGFEGVPSNLPDEIQEIMKYQALFPSPVPFDVFIDKLCSYFLSEKKVVKKTGATSECPVILKMKLFHLAWATREFEARNMVCPEEHLHKAAMRTFSKTDIVPEYFVPAIQAKIINPNSSYVALTGDAGLEARGQFVLGNGDCVSCISMATYKDPSPIETNQPLVLKDGEVLSTNPPLFITGSIVRAINEGTLDCLALEVNGEEYTWEIKEFSEIVAYARDVIGTDYDTLYENIKKYSSEF